MVAAMPSTIRSVSASVSNSSPSQYSNVTVYGNFKNNGQPVSGVQMDTSWHYKTTTSACSGTTGTDGTASCTRGISDATAGYTVSIGVTFTWNGQSYTTSTSFTPVGNSPSPPPSSGDPANATAKCKDGTYSYSQHASGTCSGHGGVSYWINHP